MRHRVQGHTIVYDAVDMPHRDTFGGTTEYIYTADDERIAVVTSTGQWEWSVRGPSGKVIREFGSTGSTNFQWRKDYIWRDQLLLATRQREPNGTVTTYHYHVDHLGTPRRAPCAGPSLSPPSSRRSCSVASRAEFFTARLTPMAFS